MRDNIYSNSIANYILLFIFVALIPYQEWPDVNTHWEMDSYSYIIRNISTYIGFIPITFEPSNNFSFFADKYIFESNISERFINLIKLLFIIPLFYSLNNISLKYSNRVLPFVPPLIFSILSSSIEVFAIFSIILSYIFIVSNRTLLSLIIGVLATFIDRSVVPSLVGIIIFATYLRFENYFRIHIILLISFLTIVSLIIINFFISFDDIVLQIFGFYSISNNDLIYNQQFGERNYLALISSLSGLYGWMSLRPFPWFIYYSLIILAFLIGIYVSDGKKKLRFLFFLIPVVIVLYFLPPLSQARYFPLLTILYWETVLTGVKYIFNRTDIFIFLVIVMTIAGLLFIN